MARLVTIVVVLSIVALAIAPPPAAAEIERATIKVLGGVQCTF